MWVCGCLEKRCERASFLYCSPDYHGTQAAVLFAQLNQVKENVASLRTLIESHGTGQVGANVLYACDGASTYTCAIYMYTYVRECTHDGVNDFSCMMPAHSHLLLPFAPFRLIHTRDANTQNFYTAHTRIPRSTLTVCEVPWIRLKTISLSCVRVIPAPLRPCPQKKRSSMML
jgi:hypothetical protein